jgi:hypothetical protein
MHIEINYHDFFFYFTLKEKFSVYIRDGEPMTRVSQCDMHTHYFSDTRNCVKIGHQKPRVVGRRLK